MQSLFAEILTLPLQAPSSRLREQDAGVELPPAFDPWLLRCIDRDPSRRFASAGAAVEELSRIYARASFPVSPAPSALVRSSREAQALAVTDAATPRASSVASLPALSSTRHRRTLRAPATTSPLRWVALGAAGTVLVVGAIAWLVLRGDPPSGAVVGVSPQRANAVPASAVHAARPASRPAAPASAPRAVASEPSSAPSSPVTGRREPMAGAPRIRIAPLDETPPPAAPGPSPDGGGARLAGASAGAAAAEAAVAEAAALTASSASPFVSAAPSAAPRPAAGAVAADDTPRATSPVVPAPAEPPPRKRERRRRPGSGEAYETR